MRQIRKGVFETNSSMTHSLVVCKSDKFGDWVAGKLMFKMYGQKFADVETARKENAKQFRDSIKWYEETGREYNREKFNEELISKYERGEMKESWTPFSSYDTEDYFITFDQFCNYVRMEGYELVDETSDVDGTKMTVFGYYGHD